jgi:hypothetical protein
MPNWSVMWALNLHSFYRVKVQRDLNRCSESWNVSDSGYGFNGNCKVVVMMVTMMMVVSIMVVI